MTDRAVLAVDQGTSATKALVVAPDRGVLGAASVPVHPRGGPDGAVEQDPEELYASVVEAGRAALAEAGEPVDAVGLANQGETVLAWDRRTGAPVSTALGWQDRRARTVCDRLSDRADRLAALTGLSLDPYFAAPKMTWLREHLTRDGAVSTTDSWLLHRLTGAFVTDAATASRTLLLDVDAVAWSGEALDAFGLSGEPMPSIVDCAGPVGETTAFGGRPLPVTGLAVDQQAALFGQGCLSAGSAKCTYGTGAFLLATLGGRAARSAAGLTTSVAWRLAGGTSYCLDGQAYSVGSALRWLVDLGVLPAATMLDEVAGTVPDTGGVVLVPAFAGLAAPWWRPDAHGALRGLRLSTAPGHLARALVDAIACQVVELAAAVARDLGEPLRSLKVDGGLTNSAVLMQTQADLLQAPVEVHPTADATALGVAALARLGAEPGLSPADVVGDTAPAAVYEPRIGPDEAAERRAAFRSAVASVLDERA